MKSSLGVRSGPLEAFDRARGVEAGGDSGCEPYAASLERFLVPQSGLWCQSEGVTAMLDGLSGLVPLPACGRARIEPAAAVDTMGLGSSRRVARASKSGSFDRASNQPPVAGVAATSRSPRGADPVIGEPSAAPPRNEPDPEPHDLSADEALAEPSSGNLIAPQQLRAAMGMARPLPPEIEAEAPRAASLSRPGSRSGARFSPPRSPLPVRSVPLPELHTTPS